MFGVFAQGNYAFYENPFAYEPGFMLLSKIISLMTSNFQMYLLVLNLFIFGHVFVLLESIHLQFG